MMELKPLRGSFMKTVTPVSFWLRLGVHGGFRLHRKRRERYESKLSTGESFYRYFSVDDTCCNPGDTYIGSAGGVLRVVGTGAYGDRPAAAGASGTSGAARTSRAGGDSTKTNAAKAGASKEHGDAIRNGAVTVFWKSASARASEFSRAVEAVN
jgi:hypothetical protein